MTQGWYYVESLTGQRLDKSPNWKPTIVSQRSKQLSTVAIVGFQFGLYHVVALLAVKLST